MADWLRYRIPLGFLFAAGYLLVARPSSLLAFLSSTVFVALGCLLRSWAAGYLLKGKRVAVGGPYAYVRNPLYAGSFLMGIGFCLALWRSPLSPTILFLWLLFGLLFGVIYRAKTRMEEKELSAALGDAYVVYASKVPAFLPLRGRVDGLGPQRFSGELYRRNREHQCVLGCIALLGFLYLRWAYQ